jgi:hypothetical protein
VRVIPLIILVVTSPLRRPMMTAGFQTRRAIEKAADIYSPM